MFEREDFVRSAMKRQKTKADRANIDTPRYRCNRAASTFFVHDNKDKYFRISFDHFHGRQHPAGKI